MFMERGGRTWREYVRTKSEGTCPNCNNTVEYEVWGAAAGPYLTMALMPANGFIGKKIYFVVCPICSWVEREVTKPQVQALKAASRS